MIVCADVMVGEKSMKGKDNGWKVNISVLREVLL